MMLSRRQFLDGLLSVGATLALPVLLADATPEQVEVAWKKLLSDPWYFDVNQLDMIVDSTIDEPEFYRHVCAVETGDQCTVESLIRAAEGCYPLAMLFQRMAWEELGRVRLRLDSPDLPSVERGLLEQVVEGLEDEEEGWKALICLNDPVGLPKLKSAVLEWLNTPIEAEDFEWLPRTYTTQGSAYQFFSSLPNDILGALGVAIIEGDHPGSTYCAAELKTNLEVANETASTMELPFRFRREGV